MSRRRRRTVEVDGSVRLECDGRTVAELGGGEWVAVEAIGEQLTPDGLPTAWRQERPRGCSILALDELFTARGDQVSIHQVGDRVVALAGPPDEPGAWISMEGAGVVAELVGDPLPADRMLHAVASRRFDAVVWDRQRASDSCPTGMVECRVGSGGGGDTRSRRQGTRRRVPGNGPPLLQPEVCVPVKRLGARGGGGRGWRECGSQSWRGGG